MEKRRRRMHEHERKERESEIVMRTSEPGTRICALGQQTRNGMPPLQHDGKSRGRQHRPAKQRRRDHEPIQRVVRQNCRRLDRCRETIGNGSAPRPTKMGNIVSPWRYES
jgi:hypothetical protein